MRTDTFRPQQMKLTIPIWNLKFPGVRELNKESDENDLFDGVRKLQTIDIRFGKSKVIRAKHFLGEF